MYDITPLEVKVFASSVITLSSISSLSSFSIIFLLIYHKKLSLSYWRLILCLAINDLIQSLTLLILPLSKITHTYSPTACTLQGFIIQYTTGVSSWFHLMIALHIFLVVHNYSHSSTSASIPLSIEIFFHSFPWLFSFLFASVPFLNIVPELSYNLAGPWCWLTSEPVYARFLLSFIWVWIVSGCILSIYFKVWWRIRGERDLVSERLTLFGQFGGAGFQEKRQRLMEKRMWMWPIMYVILWIPITLCRITEAMGVYWIPFELLESFVLPSVGFVDLIIFLFTSGIWVRKQAEGGGRKENRGRARLVSGLSQTGSHSSHNGSGSDTAI